MRKRIIIAVGILLVLFGLISGSKEEKLAESKFTHEEILKIDPAVVLDKMSLLSPEGATVFNQDLTAHLSKLGILVFVPMFGVYQFNPEFHGGSINIIIESPGGLVSLGTSIANLLEEIRQRNVFVNCFVSEAQSMAFFVMVTQCDNVIAKKNVLLMQHRVSYGERGYSPGTQLLDVKLARVEAEKLGVEFNSWLKFTKGNKNRVFTKKQIKQFKLVDQWMK